MRKLLAWLVVTVGIAALVRKLRRSRRSGAELPVTAPEPSVPEGEGAEDPAEELRRKLAASREDTHDEPPEADEPEESVEERRAGVHEQGRAAIDDMQRSTEE
jgi:hypothetical protein